MENNKNKTDWQKRDVGALWKRESATQKYLSGYVKVDELGIEREVKVVVFSNKNKKDNAKAPDYRIYLSNPPEAAPKTSDASKVATSKPNDSKSRKKVQVSDIEETTLEEDVL